MTFVLLSPLEFHAAVGAAKVGLAPSTCGVYGMDGAEVGELVGTGTILRLCSENYLLTAAHVRDVGEARFRGLARRSGDDLALLDQYWAASTGGLDLVLTHLPDDGNLSPVGADALGFDSAHVGDWHLLVQGFPEKKSRTSALLSAVSSETQPYITYESLAPTTYDPKVHFEIDWDYTMPQFDESGGEVYLPHPKGMSGAAVWTLGPTAQSCDIGKGARIVGVAHQFHEERRTLIVVRIEAIRAFLLATIRRRAAYLNWRGRGCPLFESETDWREAKRAIPYLW